MRVGGREGGREGEREGGREGEREGGRNKLDGACTQHIPCSAHLTSYGNQDIWILQELPKGIILTTTHTHGCG